MTQLLVIFIVPALSIAVRARARWRAVSGLWSTAVRPRPALGLIQSAISRRAA